MIKYPENYVSPLVLSLSASEIVGMTTGQTGEEAIPAEKLAEIQSHLDTAQNLYLAHEYQPAITEYKLVQGIIYNLLEPAFNPWEVWSSNLIMPVNKALMTRLFETSMALLDVLPIPQEKPLIGVADGSEVIGALKPYLGLGLKVVDKLPDSARLDSQLGATYAERGQWDRAAAYFQRASQTLVQSHAEAGEVGAQLLNLGAVLVQSGKASAALDPLKRAAESFAKAGDLVGQAQANFNMAAALTRDGKTQEAALALTTANKFLASAQERTTAPARTAAVAETATTAQPATRARAAAVVAGAVQPLTFSLDPAALDTIAAAQGQAVTYRMAGKATGWTVQTVQSKAESAQKTYSKSVSFMAAGEAVVVEWQAGTTPEKTSFVSAIYDKRVTVTAVDKLHLHLVDPVDTTLSLPHLYSYVIPVALGDCYYGLGEYDTAETYYLQAADYEYINLSLEVPALWQKLARNVLAWGDSLYKAEEPQDAVSVYAKVMNVPGMTPVVDPAAPLYKQAKLKVVGDEVLTMLKNYATAGAGTLNPMLAAVVLEIRARLLQLNAGLDFLGMPASYVPIWTFEFLQNVARYFAQKAAQAERDFIDFQDRAESEELTQLQLQQQVQVSQAECELARQQREASEAERDAYSDAYTLAQTRTTNATNNRNDYSSMSWERVWLDQSSAWYSSQNTWELENTIVGSGPDVGRHIHEVMADNALRRGEITRDYELATMDRQITEMQQAQAVAGQQLNAAQARVAAAEQMEVVAGLRASAAQQSLAAFDSQLFTPGVWNQMGEFMRDISQSYFTMALKVARLMQRAYNFENDVDRHVIRVDYSSLTVVGLLAPDALLRDVDSFTYDLITSSQKKPMPVRQTISLADSYPYLFETAFRTTGQMTFETRLEDFDMAYPGTYAQRIEGVEVEVEGVLPTSGVRGTLTNGGISRYRTQANTLKYRIQPKETLVLSEYQVKGDAIVYRTNENQLRVFEGAGTAGTWTLDIPPASNDLEYRWITDVRITFYYQARYDSTLAQAVTAALAATAGSTQQARSLSLRWTYPDIFFAFQATGQFPLSLTSGDFPYNHLNPQIKHVALLVATVPGTDPSGWTVRLGTPGHPATIGASPNAQGSIAADTGHPWAPLNTGAATGDFLIEIRPGENPALVEAGQLKLGQINDLVLILEYTFTPRT